MYLTLQRESFHHGWEVLLWPHWVALILCSSQNRSTRSMDHPMSTANVFDDVPWYVDRLLSILNTYHSFFGSISQTLEKCERISSKVWLSMKFRNYSLLPKDPSNFLLRLLVSLIGNPKMSMMCFPFHLLVLFFRIYSSFFIASNAISNSFSFPKYLSVIAMGSSTCSKARFVMS